MLKLRNMSSRLLDSPQRYGLVSRLFHWAMVAVLTWQLTSRKNATTAAVATP